MEKDLSAIRQKFQETLNSGGDPRSALGELGLPLDPKELQAVLKQAGFPADHLENPDELARQVSAMGAILDPQTKRTVASLFRQVTAGVDGKEQVTIPPQLSKIIEDWEND